MQSTHANGSDEVKSCQSLPQNDEKLTFFQFPWSQRCFGCRGWNVSVSDRLSGHDGFWR
jgi:hypothetical protein